MQSQCFSFKGSDSEGAELKQNQELEYLEGDSQSNNENEQIDDRLQLRKYLEYMSTRNEDEDPSFQGNTDRMRVFQILNTLKENSNEVQRQLGGHSKRTQIKIHEKVQQFHHIDDLDQKLLLHGFYRSHTNRTQLTVLHIQVSRNSHVVNIELQLGQYFKTFSILNEPQCSSPIHSCAKIHAFGSFGNIYLIDFMSQRHAVKCIKVDSKNPNTKIQTEKFRQILEEYFLVCLCSSLEIGARVTKIFGFDLLFSQKCIEFSTQICQSIHDFEAQQIAQDLKLALLKLHRLRIVHKDIKPTNFMYSSQLKKYVLIDFGISRVLVENIGMKTYCNYSGTVGFCGAQMSKLFNGSSDRIDLYMNDIEGMQKSLSYLSKLEDKKKSGIQMSLAPVQSAEGNNCADISNQGFCFLTLINLQYSLSMADNEFSNWFVEILYHHSRRQRWPIFEKKIFFFLIQLKPTVELCKICEQGIISKILDNFRGSGLDEWINCYYAYLQSPYFENKSDEYSRIHLFYESFSISYGRWSNSQKRFLFGMQSSQSLTKEIQHIRNRALGSDPNWLSQFGWQQQLFVLFYVSLQDKLCGAGIEQKLKVVQIGLLFFQQNGHICHLNDWFASNYKLEELDFETQFSELKAIKQFYLKFILLTLEKIPDSKLKIKAAEKCLLNIAVLIDRQNSPIYKLQEIFLVIFDCFDSAFLKILLFFRFQLLSKNLTAGLFPKGVSFLHCTGIQEKMKQECSLRDAIQRKTQMSMLLSNKKLSCQSEFSTIKWFLVLCSIYSPLIHESESSRAEYDEVFKTPYMSNDFIGLMEFENFQVAMEAFIFGDLRFSRNQNSRRRSTMNKQRTVSRNESAFSQVFLETEILIDQEDFQKTKHLVRFLRENICYEPLRKVFSINLQLFQAYMSRDHGKLKSVVLLLEQNIQPDNEVHLRYFYVILICLENAIHESSSSNINESSYIPSPLVVLEDTHRLLKIGKRFLAKLLYDSSTKKHQGQNTCRFLKFYTFENFLKFCQSLLMISAMISQMQIQLNTTINLQKSIFTDSNEVQQLERIQTQLISNTIDHQLYFDNLAHFADYLQQNTQKQQLRELIEKCQQTYTAALKLYSQIETPSIQTVRRDCLNSWLQFNRFEKQACQRFLRHIETLKTSEYCGKLYLNFKTVRYLLISLIYCRRTFSQIRGFMLDILECWRLHPRSERFIFLTRSLSERFWCSCSECLPISIPWWSPLDFIKYLWRDLSNQQPSADSRNAVLYYFCLFNQSSKISTKVRVNFTKFIYESHDALPPRYLEIISERMTEFSANMVLNQINAKMILQKRFFESTYESQKTQSPRPKQSRLLERRYTRVKTQSSKTESNSAYYFEKMFLKSEFHQLDIDYVVNFRINYQQQFFHQWKIPQPFRKLYIKKIKKYHSIRKNCSHKKLFIDSSTGPICNSNDIHLIS